MKRLFVVSVMLLLLIGAVSADAFSAWSLTSGCYTATNSTHTRVLFNATGDQSFPTPSGVTSLTAYEVIAGGGAGGSSAGGGGGAGGFRYGINLPVSGNIAITVGTGGTQEIFSPRGGGTNGTDSVLHTITATGGGWGASDAVKPPASGGSGGGAVFRNNVTGAASSPVTSPVQGYKGGDSSLNAPYRGGGGGGAGGAGTNGGAGTGAGGIGLPSALFGSTITFSTGGSGYDAGAAAANYGDGGGGTDSVNSYAGKQGIIIIEYETPISAPIASFSQNRTEGAAPLSVLFTDTSTNLPKVWNWSVNNTGWTSRTWYNDTMSTNLVQTFSTPGIYNITLSVQNLTVSPTISTVQHDVLVNETLTADFVGAPLSGYATTDVSFVDFSVGEGIYSWAWTFGDGGTSTDRNPTHPYSTAGSFNVSLTVIGIDGTSTKTETDYITISEVSDINPLSTYRFKPDANIIRNSTLYNRTIQMGNVTNTTYAIGSTTFDAGNIMVTRVLVNKSTYSDISLVSSTINNTTGIATFNVTRTGGFDPGATFVSIVDVEMLYYNYHTGTTGAAWGSGSLINGTYRNTFPVTYLSDSPLTYEWETFSDFTISDATPTSGVTVVTLTPSDRPEASDRFLWNFGDGTTFLDHNGTSVTHIYTGVGPVITPFSTSLTAYLSANTSITNTTTKTVSPVYPPQWVKANFTALKTNVGSAEIVDFIDSSEFGNTSAVKIYNWAFGDGSFSSTVGDVRHVYSYYGIYTVQLNVSNNNDPALGNSTLIRTDYIQVSVDNAGTKLNVLYPHEVQFSLVDTGGNPLSDVDVAIVMSNSTVGNTNWFTTLFGISSDATPVDTTVLIGTSDDDGSVTFPLISSGRYTMSFNSTMRGISETKSVYPQQANYVIVLHPNAALIPNRNNYINATLYVTTPNESYADLSFSYTDLSASTTSISFYVDYSNHTRFNTQTFAGINATGFKSVPNVKATSYVFGYYANSSMFGNVSASQGIMMKGVTGKLINLDPCGGYARGWGSQC